MTPDAGPSDAPVLVAAPFAEGVAYAIAPEDARFPHANWESSKHAIDLDVPLGTPVRAIRSGIVLHVVDQHDEHGYDRAYAEKANLVCIDHGDGTYAEYIHLGCREVDVFVGQRVKKGDVLGRTGLSGCMDEPHLHLNLFYLSGTKPISIPFRIAEA